jgi:predicted GH43/DUF377 family glycosyl hydrolase
VWLSRSTYLETWREPEPVMSRREGGGRDSARIGMGPPPLETEHGWLVVYHRCARRMPAACTARACRCRSADTRIGLATASRADVLDYLFACPSG